MRSTFTLKALWLCALMVGVMAISASAAQAEATSKWMEAGRNIEGAAESATVEGDLENHIGRLLTTINGLHIEVVCSSGNILGNVKLIKEGKTTEGTATASGCEVFKTSPTLEPLGECEVKTLGQPFGTVESLRGYALLELHMGGKAVTLIIPLNGIFAHLEFFEEEEFACGVLPEEVLIGGTLAGEDCENAAETEQSTHLIVIEPDLSHVWVISDTSEHHITVDGSANVFLSNDANVSALPG